MKFTNQKSVTLRCQILVLFYLAYLYGTFWNLLIERGEGEGREREILSPTVHSSERFISDFGFFQIHIYTPSLTKFITKSQMVKFALYNTKIL